MMAIYSRHWGPERSVQILRDPTKSLGISIVGGKVCISYSIFFFFFKFEMNELKKKLINFCLNWSMIRWMWPRAVGHPLPVFSSRMSFLKVQPDELDSCGYVCRLSHYTRLHTIDYFSFSKYFIFKFSLIFFWFIWFDLIVKSIDWWPDFRRGRWRLAWSQSRKSRRSHPQSWKSCHFPRSISGRFREFCLFEIILKHFDRQRLNFHFFFFPPKGTRTEWPNRFFGTVGGLSLPVGGSRYARYGRRAHDTVAVSP